MAGCVKCGRWFWNRSGNLPPICPRCAGRQPAAVDAAIAGAVQRPIITWALASACVIVFLLMIADGASVFEPSADQVLAWGGDFGPATLGNDWWRLVTATFVHFGLLHLALNMWCLVTLGPIAERVFGRGSFLLLYLLSGIAGSTTSLLVHPLIVGAGASGAIFGVAGRWSPRGRGAMSLRRSRHSPSGRRALRRSSSTTCCTGSGRAASTMQHISAVWSREQRSAWRSRSRPRRLDSEPCGYGFRLWAPASPSLWGSHE